MVVVVQKFRKELGHAVTRPVGMEAVMRLRCTKGISIHSYHGHFFVRSTDLLAIPSVNPTLGYSFQLTVCPPTTIQCFSEAP